MLLPRRSDDRGISLVKNVENEASTAS